VNARLRRAPSVHLVPPNGTSALTYISRSWYAARRARVRPPLSEIDGWLDRFAGFGNNASTPGAPSGPERAGTPNPARVQQRSGHDRFTHRGDMK
jgi:hypothetical protein